MLRRGGDRPQLHLVAPKRGSSGVFTLEPDHVGIETFENLVRHSAPFRYIWLSELDLMAKIIGFRLRDRWAGWNRAPYTSGCHSQVAVFEKLP